MSSRQMAHAAADGRRVLFQWLAHEPKVVVEGYLVGMDDYHYLLFTKDFHITLIHKTSPDLIVIEKESSLNSERDYLKVAVKEIGGDFFAYCNRIFLGNKSASE